MANLYFVTFGNQRFTQRRWKLADEIKSSNWFQDIFVYGEEDVREVGKPCRGTGGGWWWWKSVIQKKALERIKENDILLYLDAGCYFNRLGVNEFDRYVKLLCANDGFLGFNTGAADTSEKTYTKRDLFKLLECESPEYTDSMQIASGLFLIRKNKLSVNLINEYVRVSMVEHCLDDTPSLSPNYPEYWNHKNDQSVFSLLVKKIYKEKNIDLLTLSSTIEDGKFYQYSDDVKTVCNSIKNNQPEELTKLKFPIITARIDDDYYTTT